MEKKLLSLVIISIFFIGNFGAVGTQIKIDDETFNSCSARVVEYRTC